jgi:UDP-N-acetylmuramate dehydrogenase
VTVAPLAPPLDRVAELLGPLAERDRPLGPLTTYRVGGPAAVFAEVASEADLEQVVRAVTETGVEPLVVGQGSNLLVADAGFAGLALRLAGGFAAVELDPDGSASRVVAGAAVAYPVLARRSAARGLSGLEWAVGIPGSVGGAVCMNAGGHGSDTASVLVSARVVELAGGRDRLLRPPELEFGYRHSAIGAADLVLGATFAVEAGEAGACEARISEIVRWRRANQPGGQNAGSVFTNPPGDSAGRLVEAAGLKGLRIGTAEVSPKHGNFIQADAGGSADDVARLVDEVRRLVLERTGVQLETELRMKGFSR